MDEFCGSVFWDTNLTWNTDQPDFTPCFMQTALVYVPCIFLLALTPLDIHYARTSKYADIPWCRNNVTRLLLNALLIGISAADLVAAATWTSSAGDEQLFAVHLVTPVVKIITFTLAATLILVHRKCGIQSSGALFMFWSAVALLAVPQFRHGIMQFEQRGAQSTIGTAALSWADYQFITNTVHFGLLLAQLLAHCFADASPSRSRYDRAPKQQRPCPEQTASFLSRVVFAWFEPLPWRGFRRALTDSDLWDINPADTSEAMTPKFDKYWQQDVAKKAAAAAETKGKDRHEKSSAHKQPPQQTHGNIIPVLFRTFGGQFYLAGVQKLLIDLLSFAPPQLLGLLVTFAAVPDTPMWHGIAYTAALLLISMLTALLNGQQMYLSTLVGYRIRTVLISAIYRKSLRLSSAARRETTVGEVVNLMAVDAQRFLELIVFLHMAWSAPLIAAICMYFLYSVLGVAAFAGLAVLLVMTPISGYIAAKLKHFQTKQMTKKDERIRMMNEILGGMKVLKLYAWEPSFEAAVERTRAKELQIIRHAAITNAFIFLQFNMLPFLVMLVSFVVFMFADPRPDRMNPNTFFVALSLFNILRMPMTMFPLMVAQMMQGWVAVKRINRYLNSEDLDVAAVSHATHANALEIVEGTFTWAADGEVVGAAPSPPPPVLRNISMQVKRGELVAIVGPVGSGKSSMVFSLLGDTKIVRGTCNIDGTVAYVAQQAWIQNATLQENILFGLPLEREFYERVLEACALVSDLQILAGGDQTEIGEKGINLSGGQKQRVALARAVYARADIYMLDDPLSAVDAHVGKHIFENVIGPHGLLAGRTRLLVTHGIAFLPQADTIFVLNAGVITESGPYGHLVERKGAFAEFLRQHLQEIDLEDEDELEAIRQALERTNSAELLERAISKVSTKKQKRTSESSDGKKPAEPIIAAATKDGTKLIQSEVSAVGGVGWSVYVQYIRSVGWWITWVTIAGSIAYQALSIFSNTWLAEWSAHPRANEPDTRDLYLGVYAGLGMLTGSALFVTSLAMAYGCLHAARELHSGMLHRTMRLPMAFFDTTPIGRIMNRFTKDVDVIDNMLPQSLRAWILMAFSALGILIVISLQTPIFIAVIVPLSIFYYFIQRFFVATSRQLKRIESVTRSPIYSHFGETIAGQTTIRAYGAEQRFVRTSERHVDHNQRCVYPSLIAGRWLGVRLEFIGALVLLFAALFAVLARGTIEANMVGLSITYALQITGTLSFLVRLTAEVETHIVANERLAEYSNVATEAPWVVGSEKSAPLNGDWPRSGALRFDDFQLRYRDGLELVLRGITFAIRGGEKIGIVGRTGAGKSSLTLALFRLIESAGGSISIDGVPIAGLGLHELRSRLTIIPQEPVLFAGTLRMNVDPFDAFADAEVWRALELAHLKAFVQAQQAGLGQAIAEGGENLSIGQRQLVCLARALLRKTRVLVLDEATAAIDLETDDLIQATIREQFRECTVLTIAHRLNTILDSDRVLVLDGGRVAEMDAPQTLLNDRRSIFYSMARDAGLTGNATATTTVTGDKV